MKHLKKTLALALVVVMALGLIPFTPFTPQAAAADGDEQTAAFDPAAPLTFPDLDDVNPSYATAMRFFGKSGLAAGNDDGTLDPKGNLTRAQAATILARLMLGVDAASKLPNVKTRFIDVDEDFWGSAAINYVAGAGLMVGTGNPTGAGDTFSPNAQLSIAHWEVVMLRLAGYGQAEEFLGGQWAFNADRLTKEVGLHNGATTVNFRIPGYNGSLLIDYDDHMANITREKAYAFIWNNIWFMEEVAYQYGSYRPRNTTVSVAGGNTTGTLVGQALGFSKGWFGDEEGFGDIIGEFFAYSKAIAGNYTALASGIDTFTNRTNTNLDSLTTRRAVMTLDLSVAIAEKRILHLDFPTGPSTESIRTAIRSINQNTSADNWTDTLIYINGEVLRNPAATGGWYNSDYANIQNYSRFNYAFSDYLDFMPDRSPAFGYESNVNVWAVPDALAGRSGEWTPLRTTVKLPALGQVGDKVTDDPYTHLVNEAGIRITVFRSVPENVAQFNPREDDGLDIDAVMMENTNLKSYRDLSAMTKGTFVTAYPQGIRLNFAYDEDGTQRTGPGPGGSALPILRLEWQTKGNPKILTAEPAKQQTVSVTAKRTGYLTIAGEGEVSEATWIVGESPYPDSSSYQVFRDRFDTVLGTNAVFQGRNPFAGILRVVDVRGHEVTKGDPTSEVIFGEPDKALITDGSTILGSVPVNLIVTVTAELLGENTEYGENAACTVEFNIDARQALSTWLTGAAVTRSETPNTTQINERVEKPTHLINNFYRYSYTMNYGNPVFRLQYLNPALYEKLPTELPKENTNNWANWRTVTYMWTQGYNQTGDRIIGTSDGDLGRFVRTYTEKSPNRRISGERGIYDNGEDYGAYAPVTNTAGNINPPSQIARKSGNKIVDVGIINPYKLSPPREFAFFTGKVSYTRDDWYIASFLMDGRKFDRKVDTIQFDLVASDHDVGFYSLVGNFYEQITTLYRLGPHPDFGTSSTGYGNRLKFNDGLWQDNIEPDDRYDLFYEKMGSQVANRLATLYPWALHSQWRDVREDDLSPAYTNALNSEAAITIRIEDRSYDGKSTTEYNYVDPQRISNITQKTYGSDVTQSWIIPDRYYTGTDLTRLGLRGPLQDSGATTGPPPTEWLRKVSLTDFSEERIKEGDSVYTQLTGILRYVNEKSQIVQVTIPVGARADFSDFFYSLKDRQEEFKLDSANLVTGLRRLDNDPARTDEVELPVTCVSPSLEINVSDYNDARTTTKKLQVTIIGASFTGKLTVRGNVKLQPDGIRDTAEKANVSLTFTNPDGSAPTLGGELILDGANVEVNGTSVQDVWITGLDVKPLGSILTFSNAILIGNAALNITVRNSGAVDLTGLDLGAGGTIGIVDISGVGNNNLADIAISVRFIVDMQGSGTMRNPGLYTGSEPAIIKAENPDNVDPVTSQNLTFVIRNASVTSLSKDATTTSLNVEFGTGETVRVTGTGEITITRPQIPPSTPVLPTVVYLHRADGAVIATIKITFTYGANPSTKVDYET